MLETIGALVLGGLVLWLLFILYNGQKDFETAPRK
jgi:hypothetical protein